MDTSRSMRPADIRLIGGRKSILPGKWTGPADRRRRLVLALARCFVLATDRVVYDRKMIIPVRSIIPFTDPVADPDRRWWSWRYTRTHPLSATPVKAITRREILKRIADGNLGIDDRLEAWTGAFWYGLRISGAVRRGSGTEFRIWEQSHQELVSDLVGMPLPHKLEPRAARGAQRRLRRCYCALLPPEDPVGARVLAGLLAGAVLRDAGDGAWLEVPDNDDVRAVVSAWGMPFQSLERPRGRRIIQISPFWGALAAHLMPPNSARRMLAVKKAGGCPFLPAVLWEMTMARRNASYLPFPNGLPFGVSKATFFRRGWRRRDLHKDGWLRLGIRITPSLRDLVQGWYERRLRERSIQPVEPAVATH